MASIIDKRLALHQRLAKREQEYTALKSQNVQLQALANLGSATSMIAHEINNLLTPLANYAALAARNPQDADLVAKVLDKTVRNCERASRIMSSMLALANGRTEEKQQVPVRALVDEVFTCLCRDFNKDGIIVRMEISETLEVVCVPVQVQQVFMNLILNARDAMLPGGGLLKVAAVQDGPYVDITVADTGRGIAAENLETIFEPFFTTKATQENPATYSGSGVGLAFCKRVVDAHGGAISVESHPGEGATFRVRLPQAAST
ncbi:MAG: HAMP domain-containing sensor histidine kinase [Planctomycetota bacterium]|nr:HAMP domain-containing sensor histidine kinase [Planctomycetota bacterium]